MTTETYTLNGQTDFEFNHPVRLGTELTVEVVPGGVVSPASYEVIGASPGATGVTVRYPTAPADGTKVLKITRQAELQRLSDFTGAAGVNATGLEKEFNNLYRALRDISPGQSLKSPVKVVSQSNIDLTTGGEQTVNNVSAVEGDRVLVAAQSDDTENGIYNVSKAAWTRAPDADIAESFVSGTLIQDENSGLFYSTQLSGEFDPGVTSINFRTVDIGGYGDAQYVTLAGLKQADTSNSQVKVIAGSGRAGTFWFDSSDLSTEVSNDPQEGIYVAPDSDPTGSNGAWIRQFSGAVSIEWFGAVGDGSTIDTAPLQKAIDTGLTVYIPAGTYQIDAAITLDTRDQTIFGSGNNTVIRQATDDTDVLVISDQATSGVQIWDMLLTGDDDASFTTAGAGIKSLHSGDLYFYNVTTVGLYRGAFVDTRTNVSQSNVYITRCNFFDAAERGLFLRNATNVFVSYTRALSCSKGIGIVDGSAYHLDHCLLNGNTTQGLQVGVDTSSSVDWIWLTAVEADNNGDSGLQFADTRGLHMTSCWGGTNAAEGIEFLSANERTSLANCTANSNDRHGFYLAGLVRSNLATCRAADNQASGTTERSGFFIGTGADDLTLMGCLALDEAGRQSFGFNVEGSASNITVIGGQARGNTVAQVRNTTSGGGVTIRRVRGYVTKASGSVTYPAGGPAPAVSHGLDGTPTRVLFSPRSDDENLRYWAGNFNSSTFDLLANTDPGSDVVFDWIAFIGDDE